MNEGRKISITIDPSAAKSGAREVRQALEAIKSSTKSMRQQFDDAYKSVQRFADRIHNLNTVLSGISPPDFMANLIDQLSNVNEMYSTFADTVQSQGVVVEASLDQQAQGYDFVYQAQMQLGEALQYTTELRNTEIRSLNDAYDVTEKQAEALTSEAAAYDEKNKVTRELMRAQARLEAMRTSEYRQLIETKNAIHDLNKELGSTSDIIRRGDIDDLHKSFQNTAKAVVLALGPLSGVAARVTAFASLVKANTASIATFVGVMTSLAVVTHRAVYAGIELERQMLGMQASIISTGRELEITAGQLNAIAEGIAEATLSGTQETRQAMMVLLSYRDLSVNVFQDIIESAQGVASVFGNNIVSSVRQMARAMEAPSKNLDSLRRMGVQFTDAQRGVIESLERTGRTAEAQAMIMDRLSVFQDLAKEEAQGLAGAMDTLSERVLKLYEATSETVGINDTLAQSIASAADVVRTLTEEQDRLIPIINAVGYAVEGAASAVGFLTDNTGVLVVIFGSIMTAALASATLYLARLITKMILAGKTTGSTMGLISQSADLARLAFLGVATGATTATTAVARLSAAFQLLGRVIPLLTAIGTAVALWSFTFSQSARAATEYDHAIQSLNRTSTAFNQIQGLAKENLEATGMAMKLNAEAIARLTREEYENTFRALVTTTREAIREIERMGQRTGPGPLDNYLRVGNNREIVRVRDELRQLIRDFQDGADVSANRILDIQRDMEALGVTFGDGETSILEFVQGLKILGDEADSADRSLQKILETFEQTGQAINLGQLFSGIQENAGDLLMDVEQVLLNMEIMSQQHFARMGDNAMQMARTQFEPVEDLYNRMLEAGQITQKEHTRLISMMEIDMKRLENSILNVEAAFKEAKLSAVNDFFRDVQHHSRLLTADTDDLRESIQAAYDQERTIQRYVDQMAAGISTTEDMRATVVQLQASAAVAGVVINDLIREDGLLKGAEDATKSLETLEEVIRRISGGVDNFTTSVNRGSRATRASAAATTDWNAELERLRRSIDPLYDAQRDYAEALEIIDKAVADVTLKEELRTAVLERYIDAEREATGVVHEKHEGFLQLMDTLFPLEEQQRKYRENVDLLTEAMLRGVIGIDRYNEAMQRLNDSMRNDENWQDVYGFDVDSTAENLTMMEEFAKSAAQNMQSSFANFLFDPFQDGLRGMAHGFAQTLHRMASEMLASQILQMAFGAMGGGGGPLAAFAGAFDRGGFIPKGQWGIVGEKGPEIVQGPASVTGRQETAQMSQGGDTKIINVLDPSLVGEYLNTPQGERVIMNVMRRNRNASNV